MGSGLGVSCCLCQRRSGVMGRSQPRASEYFLTACEMRRSVASFDIKRKKRSYLHSIHRMQPFFYLYFWKTKHYIYTNINILYTVHTKEKKKTRRNECQKCLNYFKPYVWSRLAICDALMVFFFFFFFSVKNVAITIILIFCVTMTAVVLLYLHDP